MQQTPEIIHAEVSQDLIHKTDRLFLNSDAGVWVELLQNSRRAGSTRIDISIDERPPEQCLVTVRDNGTGVTDFRKLVVLGESFWDEDTRWKEDPAGMGLFALCRSDVEVH